VLLLLLLLLKSNTKYKQNSVESC